MCFPVNFAKFLRTPLFIERLWWLLLLAYSLQIVSPYFDFKSTMKVAIEALPTYFMLSVTSFY